MPTPSEYANAIEWANTEYETNSGVVSVQSAATIALRCLRVVAAMEAGTVNGISFNGVEWMAWRSGSPIPHVAADPLTAAERAMGVAT